MRLGRSLTATLLLLTWAATMSAVSARRVSSASVVSAMGGFLKKSRDPCSGPKLHARSPYPYEFSHATLRKLGAKDKPKSKFASVGQRIVTHAVRAIVIVAAPASRDETSRSIHGDCRVAI